MKDPVAPAARHRGEGFTLVETLVAIVVLIFGLMAVTNLLFLAASSNTAANQASAATASASQVMDVLRTTRWDNLLVGGNLDTDTTSPTLACRDLADWSAAASPDINAYNCIDDIPGVGRIVTRWQVSAVPGTVRLRHIAVRSEGTGALSAGRSRATFTTLRACTDSVVGSCGANPCCPQDP